MNAVIVDIKGKYAAALDENGTIIKIPNADYALGQKIQLHELPTRRHVPSLKRIGTVAAAAALVLSIGTGTAYALPYGTVSLDADAAIEYTINRFDRVLSVRALNEEGEAILSEIDPQSLRFRPVEQAITVTLDVPELSTNESSPIRITASTRDERHSERLQEHLMEQIPSGILPPELQPEHDGLTGGPPAVPEKPENTVRPEDGLNGNTGLYPGISQNPPVEAGSEQNAFRNEHETPEAEQVPQEGPDSEQISPHDQAAPFEPGHEGTLEPPSGMPAPSGPTGAPAKDSGMHAMPQSENSVMPFPQQDSSGNLAPGGPPPEK